MKRNEIVEKLMKEGFSEKTLVKLNDKQLGMMAERMLGEQSTPNAGVENIPATDTQSIQAAKQQKKKFVTYEGDVSEELKGNQTKLDKNHNGKIDAQDFKILKGQKKKEVKEEKPSDGLSKEKKSEVVKKAKKGGDVGKKGKGFEKIADKAAEKYGSKEAGEKVAAAAMWKNVKREQKEVDEWVDSLIENDYHCLTTKDEIMELINVKLLEQDPAIAEPDIDTDTEVDEPRVDPNEDPFIDPWKEPGVGPDPDPKFETGKEQLPDFLKFDNIINSVNESTIDNISSIILQKIKNGKK
jgi:hypothetical protein